MLDEKSIEFIKALDKDKIYCFAFKVPPEEASWIPEFLEEVYNRFGVSIIPLLVKDKEDVQILEPLGIDKEKLKELLR